MVLRWYFRNFRSAAAPISRRETTWKNVYLRTESICLVSPYEADLSVISQALLVVIPFGDSAFLFRPDGPGPYNLSKIVNV